MSTNDPLSWRGLLGSVIPMLAAVAVGGGISAYVTVQILDAKLGGLSGQVAELKSNVEDVNKSLVNQAVINANLTTTTGDLKGVAQSLATRIDDVPTRRDYDRDMKVRDDRADALQRQLDTFMDTFAPRVVMPPRRDGQ
jgi:hypothetical protein